MVRGHRPGGRGRRGGDVKRLRWLIVAAAMVLVVAMTAGPATGAAKENLTATDVGITPTEIRIGVIADTGSPLAPGLFQGSVDGVKAWAKYMNANEGGLAGPQDRRRHLRLEAERRRGPQRDHRGVQQGLRDRRHVGAVPEQRRRPRGLQGLKGAATGIPDFPVVTTEVVQQCSPVSFGINPPIIDCATKDQHPQTYRASLGATNYYLKKFGKNGCTACSSTRPTSSRRRTRRSRRSPRSSRRASSRTPTFDVSARAPQSAYTPFVQAIKDKRSPRTPGAAGNDAGVDRAARRKRSSRASTP